MKVGVIKRSIGIRSGIIDGGANFVNIIGLVGGNWTGTGSNGVECLGNLNSAGTLDSAGFINIVEMIILIFTGTNGRALDGLVDDNGIDGKDRGK